MRSQYASAGVDIHITGFAKIVGDLIDGVRAVLLFFAIAVVIAAAMVFAYTRCVRSTALVVCASLMAVVWQLGLLPLLGQSLDPYSILVPFLIFAIGMSHGAQKMNGIMQDIGRGIAQAAGRALHLPPPVPGRPDRAAGRRRGLCGAAVDRHPGDPRTGHWRPASGVAVLIFTNLILLPILLSYTGVSASAAERSLRAEAADEAGAAQAIRCGVSSTCSRNGASRPSRWSVAAVLAALGFTA